MIGVSPFLAVTLVILWVIGVLYCTVQYLRAVRSGKTLEKWLWFILWCIFVTFIEWVVYFGGDLACRLVGWSC